MLTVCYAAKGGQGCTTIAATLGVLSTPATIVDLAGDIPAVLGLPEPSGPGITNLLAADRALTEDDLDSCALPAADALRVVPRGDGHVDDTSARWRHLASLLADNDHTFYVDAGVGSPITKHAASRLLVIRHCYLALRRARLSATRPTGVISLREPGRSLDNTDIERIVGVPVRATVEVAPEVARAIDAGLLAFRLPSPLERALRDLARP